MDASPPPFARRLLARLTPARDREYLLGDADEVFGRLTDTEGRWKAIRWYLSEVWSAAMSSVRRPGAAPRRLRRSRGGGGPGLMREFAFAARALRKSPGLTVAALLTLAVGIGAASAAYSFTDALLLRPLPYPSPEHLVVLWGTVDGSTTRFGNASYPDLEDWRRGARDFEGIGGYNETTRPLLASDGSQLVSVVEVTGDFFAVLGLRAAVGRLPSASDLAPDGPAVAIVSDHFWRAALGGDSAVVGTTVRLGEESYRLAGVLAARPTAFPSRDAAFWIPYRHDISRGSRALIAVGRLRRGATFNAATAELDRLESRLASIYPESNAGRSLAVIPLQDVLVGDVRETLLLVFGAGAVVFLLALFNVTSLLRCRALDRRQELAVRAALGGSRRALIRTVLSESILLALAGGAVGVVVAAVGIRLAVHWAPPDLQRLREVALNGGVVLFALGLGLAAALVPGAVAVLATGAVVNPARILGKDRNDQLAAGGRWTRDTIVVVEVALSLAALAGSLLLVRSLWRLQSVDPGFSTEDLLTFRISLPRSNYPDAARVLAFQADLLDAVGRLPGVLSAGGVSVMPLSGNRLNDSPAIDGGPPRADLAVEFRSATPTYLQTLGLEIVRGRGLEARADREVPRVALVNATLAREAWPEADPLGHTITMFNDTFTVVGVIGDAHQMGLERGTAPEMVVPYTQVPRRYMTVVIRTAGERPELARTIIGLVAAADPEVPVERLRTATEYLDVSLTAPRFRTGVVALLGIVALILAAVGVYGVASFGVRSRVREIGVRMALGAERWVVVRWVVGRGMALVGIGLVLGTPLALGVTYLLRHLLFGVTPLDPATLILTPAVLIAAALIALTIPGARAAAVDPVVTLRSS